MPPLAEAFADFKGFAPDEKRVDRMFRLFLVMIQRQRKSVPQRFYSTRDVAKFFKVSIFTVCTVYQRLEQKGLLTRVRSSQTMISARAPRTRFRVRGVVAMPIWMPGFLQFLDWRQWFSTVEEELSRQRFVAEPIFFKANEADAPNFAERMLKFNPDYILWFSPMKTDIKTMLSIKDAGVPLIVVNQPRHNFPARCYPMSSEKALQEGLTAWVQDDEIERLFVVQPHAKITALTDLERALQRCPLPHRVEVLPALDKAIIPAFFRRLTAKPRSGIIFGDDLFYTHLCNLVPDTMMEIFRRHRVMVQRRVVTPGAAVKTYTADGIFYSWRRLARRIANDLDQAKGPIPTVQPVFHAEWCPRLSLAEVCQRYPNE